MYLDISLHYIFSYVWVENRVYLINLQNLMCADVVKCQVKVCILFDFLHTILFLTNLGSGGLAGRMKSVGGPHAARGPRVGQHWPTALVNQIKFM